MLIIPGHYLTLYIGCYIETPLPPHSSDYDLANEFRNFFKERIQSIHDFLDNPQSVGTNSRWKNQPKFTTKLTEFKPIISEEEVKEIALTNLIKECIH